MNTNIPLGPLKDNAVIAIIGAGPAGTFFSLLAQKEARARGIRIRSILFDGKGFLHEGPKGCNMCAGVISLKLLQELKQLGLNIPPERVQREIHSYIFHTNAGSHMVISPPGRGPLPVVYRGNGPRYSGEKKKISFDDFLLEEAKSHGAEIIPSNITSLSFPKKPGQRPKIFWDNGDLEADLVVVACGVSSSLAEQLAGCGIDYQSPICHRAFQAELDLSDKALEERLGNSIHVFSLGLKDIRFAAIIPKTRFATVSLVGKKDLTLKHFKAFMESPTLHRLFPEGWRLPAHYCCCRPRFPVKGAKNFFSERLLFVGDAAMSRYYKNGIESAFYTARYAVQAAFDHGLSAPVLRKSYYFYVRQEFVRENKYARLLFQLNDYIATKPFWVKNHLHFVRNYPRGQVAQTLHFLTWSLFTGDANYREIIRATLNPYFILKMLFTNLTLPSSKVLPEDKKLSPLRPAVLTPEYGQLGPLSSGKTVVIIGGGTGGTACGIALKRIAKERGINLHVVLYEGKDIEHGRHYNQCAGVLSPPIAELMKENLGLDFPHEIVERNIRAYRLCNKKQSLFLTSSTHCSYAVRRSIWDQFMLAQAKKAGVEVIDCRTTNLESRQEGVTVYGENRTLRADVVVGAFGLDPGTAAIFNQWNGYTSPVNMETIVINIHPPQEWMEQFKEEIFAYIPPIPDISFGAITPKANHLTINIAGSRVSSTTMEKFLNLPEVRQWLPKGYDLNGIAENCHKGQFPNRPAKLFFADRFVAVGDASGLVRPFKGKGITSACMTGIAAAKVMMDYGISRKAFSAYHLACQPILSDRYYGWGMQRLTDLFRLTGSVDALLEQGKTDAGLRRTLFLSVSGEEPYQRIFLQGFQISRAVRLLREIVKQKVLKKYA